LQSDHHLAVFQELLDHTIDMVLPPRQHSRSSAASILG
jgi:hypothetical protein